MSELIPRDWVLKNLLFDVDRDVVRKVPKVDAGLAASIFHFGEVAISDLKKELCANGIDIRI